MPDKKEAPFVLIDGSSYFYRAYHALPPLTNSEGQPTGAIYGVVKMIKRLVKDYQPKYMAVVFDAKGKTFRHDMYPEYKANRPPMPEDLVAQIKPLHEIIRAMNIPLLMVEGVEADDVIGTLAKQATKKGVKTIISASDKDLAQLVNEYVTLVDTMSNVVLDITGVEKKFGVPPSLMIDYLTLIGDTSDNVPGVDKVGPKTAVKWLAEYGSLDEVIQHADEIKGKVGENLRNSLDKLKLSRELVTIKCDVKLDVDPKDLIDEPDDETKLHELFETLEFKTWLTELGNTVLQKNGKMKNNKRESVLHEKVLMTWLQEIKKKKIFSFDTETTSLDYMQAEIVGVSFCLSPHKAAYVPLQHNYAGTPKQLNFKMVLEKLKPILENQSIKKIGQHLKYDKEVLANYNIDLQGIAYDTMLESYVLDSTESHRSLDALAEKHLHQKTITYEEVAGKGAKQIPFAEVDIEKATEYAAEDADVALQLHQKLYPQIEKDKKLKHVFEKIEMPLVNVLARMERFGVLVDADELKQQSKNVEKQIKILEQKIITAAGATFNIDSPKQLQEILYTKLKLPILRKTPTGQASTAEDVLQELALDYPLPKYILEYRTLAKLKSTYLDRLPEQINKKTGRIHTSYHQAITSTGRLSSSDPNLQNIPIRTEAGRRIRRAFTAPRGYQLLAADYSQIELRIVAHLSQDKGLLRAFAKGLDIHRATASEVFGVAFEKVTQDQRRKAKAINFGLIYGMGPFGLAKQIGVEHVAAKAYIDSYFARYPDVKKYMEQSREFARKNKFVETLQGRRLYVPEINAKNKQVQHAAERVAINAPLQGTAADIIKLAMIEINDWLKESNIKAYIIMQVHDELVFEIANEDLEKAKHTIEQIMISAVKLDVPIVVDIGTGKNWDEAH